MPVLSDAHDFVITGGDFRVQNLNVCQHGLAGIDILYEASTPEAAVDAEERSYAPSCYPGTRDQYIEDIDKWAMAGSIDNVQPVYWMKGPAGVGKSAIAQTCATKLKGGGQLGAAFFFSINGRRKDHTRFFPTLAYQLSTIYHEYREIINHKVSVDRTLVKKTMTSQFQSLIVEPLQELKEQGKELPRRVVFIDGLDECENQNAQVEIIQIIASSIRTGSTPFRWAIFSREEPHIASTFADPNISCHCHSVFLPISREADQEIELYIRGGFRNILQRRNLLSLVSSWPTAEDIKKLVDAAAGLFAHPAVVLRFIDHHSYSGFQESLEAVLTSFAKPGNENPSLYAELDKLYTLILQRIPEDIFPITLLFLSHIISYGFDDRGWSISLICNVLGISEAIFQSMYHHLQAILTVQDPPQLKINQVVAFERSYFDQGLTFKRSPSLEEELRLTHGVMNFYHKSFYDFITDPTRSSTFCVTTSAAREKTFDRYFQQYSHYASSYAVHGFELVPAPGVLSSSLSLSWPQGTEFVDSYLKLWSFLVTSLGPPSTDSPGFSLFSQDVLPSFWRKLADLDYRKMLIGVKMAYGLGLLAGVGVIGYRSVGSVQRIDHSAFRCIDKDKYDIFDPAAFLRIVEKLEKAGIIRLYIPCLGSSRAVSLLRVFSRQKPYGRSYGQYKMGHGDKSVIWYWEFDTEERYFHEFRTLDFAEAMAYYKAEKFNIWECTDEDYITDSDREDDGACGGEDDGVSGGEGDRISGEGDHEVHDKDDHSQA